MIPVGLFVIFCFCIRQTLREHHFSLVIKLYDFLENSSFPPPADMRNYPREYAKSFDAASNELIAAGMILIGDFESPEEELSYGKKAFKRTLCSPDGSIWANVKRIRSDSLCGFFISLLWGKRFLQPVVEISMFMENGEAFVILNCKPLTVSSFPGLFFSFQPDKTPAQLLTYARKYKSDIEMEETGSRFRRLDYKDFAAISISHEIRMTYQITLRGDPGWTGLTDEQLTQAGFSRRGIDNYRGICAVTFSSADVHNKAKVILELLKTKHVVMEGGSSDYRSQIVARIRSAMAVRYSVYEIPAGIDSRESYLDAVRNCFPIESPSGMDIRKMNDNQVNDVQVDWMEFRKDDSFIIWNEIRDFHNLPELYGIFDRYVSQKSLFEEEKYPRSFRLLVNSNIPLDDYIRHAQFLYPSRENESNAEKLKKHIVFFHV